VKKKNPTIKWLGGFFRKVWFLLTIKSVFSLLEGIAPYVISRSLILLVEKITSGGRFGEILPYALVLTAAIFYQRIQMNLKMPIDTLFSARSKEFVERRSCKAVRGTPLEVVESAKFQERYSHISRYVNKVSEIWDKVLIVITTGVQIVSLSVLMISNGWYYALILLAGALPLWRWFSAMGLSREELNKKLQPIKNKTGYYYSLLTNADSIKESRIFGNDGELTRRWLSG
jgi:ABC-type bacteriocin/lantibiotic exporter with double-glycine peptidase domain